MVRIVKSVRLPSLPKRSEIPRSKVVSDIKIASLVLLVCAFYWQDLSAVFASALANAELSYLFAVPALFLFLVYRKRKVLQARIANHSSNTETPKSSLTLLAGILLLATAIFAHLYGQYTFSPIELQMATLPIFIAAFIIIFFNLNVILELVFPLAFLFFMVPPPPSILYSVGSVLSDVSAHASVAVVNALGMPSKIIANATTPIVQMTRPDTSTASFAIDVSCSGIFSLITFSLITLFLAYLMRDKLWKKIAIFALGLPIIYAFNILRVTILLAVGYNYGEETAQTLFHEASGLILTTIGAITIAIVAQKLLKANFYKKQTKPCPTCASSTLQEYCSSCGQLIKATKTKFSYKDFTKIVAVATIIGLLLFLQPPLIALAKDPAGILGELKQTQEPPSVHLLPEIENYTLAFEFRDLDWETQYKQDGTLTYSYTPTNNANLKVWVLVEIANSGSVFHRWENCLITYPLTQGNQPAATQIDMRDIQLTENPPIFARHFIFHWTIYDFTQAVTYWRETLTLTTNTTNERRNIQISVITYPNQTNPSQIQQIETNLETFAKNIATYWEPLKTWVPIALSLSQNANILAAASASGLLLILPIASMQKIKANKQRKQLYPKLSEQDQNLLHTLTLTPPHTLPTTGYIQSVHQKTFQENIQLDNLQTRLQQLAQLDLVSREIQNVEDEPILTWRTKIEHPSRTQPTEFHKTYILHGPDRDT